MDADAKRRYAHVVIVGIDGMGIFCKDTDTPNMDKIFENGASTLKAESMFPTISAQNWGGMLIGADPEVHGLTNGIVSRAVYTNSELPTIFRTVRGHYPDAALCSVCNWDPINRGIIEHDINVVMRDAPDGERTTEITVECIRSLRPDLLFIHIDDPDGAGHHYDYGTEGHLESIRRCDGFVKRIYDACADAGMIDDTLFIVITDHGGFRKGHGGFTDGEKYIFFALAGKTVLRTKDFYAKTKDLNAVVRYAFGIDNPAPDADGFSSQVPEWIFRDWNGPYVPDRTGERHDVASLPHPDINSENGLLKYFPKEEIMLAMFFEYDPSDSAGKVRFREEGRVKYYSNGVRGAKAELGATGCFVTDGLRFGAEDFTVCAWLDVDNAPAAEAYYCGNKTMTDSGPGFMLGFTKAALLLGIETDDPDTYQEHTFPYFRDISGGWLHAAFVFSRRENRISVYVNFRPVRTVTLPGCFTDFPLDALSFTVGDDASRKINTGNGALINIDDLLIFGKAFGDGDISRLEDYYS